LAPSRTEPPSMSPYLPAKADRMGRLWTLVLLLGGVSLGAGTVPLTRPEGWRAATARPARRTALDPGKALQVFVTQVQDARYHPAATVPANANCGPTSLAMAIAVLGKAPVDFRDHPERLVRSLRFDMTGDRDERTWTFPYQFPGAARRHGLGARLVTGGLGKVIEELARPGHVMVLNVNPTPAYADLLRTPLDGGHFVLATGRTERGLQVLDPLAQGPLELSLEIVNRALETPLGSDVPPFRGGVSLWRLDGHRGEFETRVQP
jgi:hypothetical protein